MCLNNNLKLLLDEHIICLHIVHGEKTKSKGIWKNYYLQSIPPLTQYMTATCKATSLDREQKQSKMW